MKALRAAAFVGFAALVSAGCQGNGGGDVSLDTFADSASYAVGMNLGRSIAGVHDRVDIDLVQRGLEDVVAGRLAALSDNEAVGILQAFAAQVQRDQTLQAVGQADSNRAAGAAYLAENRERDGVTTTASGLQYEVLEEGSGPKPTTSDRVVVHYRGTLVDGSEFESSFDGEPVTFGVTDVIPGWTEALQLMSVGSRYRVVLPSELAYGQGNGPGGPNSTLIFEIQLVDILQ
jgi:FKBP-type peptidyl-prolyl cis-trans isomerase FkpA/FKBP-type peptidyl-prolyl cis-trans isomerase FklB